MSANRSGYSFLNSYKVSTGMFISRFHSDSVYQDILGAFIFHYSVSLLKFQTLRGRRRESVDKSGYKQKYGHIFKHVFLLTEKTKYINHNLE